MYLLLFKLEMFKLFQIDFQPTNTLSGYMYSFFKLQ